MPRHRVAVIGRTGRGDYGHGLDVVWRDVPDVDVVAVADDNEAGRAAAAKRLKARAAYAAYRVMLQKERPQVVEPVKEMPHVRRGASFAMRVQASQRRILPVALEGRPGLPFDEDEYLPGSDIAGRALPEPA